MKYEQHLTRFWGMNMSIFSRLKQQREDDNATDTSKYISLLASIDIHNPKPDEQKRLATLLERLGKTPEQAEADRRSIDEQKRIIAAALDTVNAASQLEDCYQKQQAALVARQVAYREHNDKCSAAIAAHDDSSTRADTHRTSLNSLRKLKAEQPALFAAIVDEKTASILKF
jgi:hypothetical protein